MTRKFDAASLDGLDEFCSPRQLEILQALRKAGSIRGAARLLGVRHSAVQGAIAAVRGRAALRDRRRHLCDIVPDGFRAKGVSTYFNKDGKPAGQWVKSTIDRARQEEILRAAFDAMAGALPRQPALPAPAHAGSADLCNQVTLTDCHVGMRALQALGGAAWNLEIAEGMLAAAALALIDRMPRAEVCVVAQLGDWLHQDSPEPVTPTNRHLLDPDGRFPEMVQAAIRILRRVVNRALETHQRVVLVLGEGNHDITSSIWLRAMFKALLENEPRCQVIDSELPYYVYQHGQVMLAFHHGHLKKNDQLPLLFAAQFPEVWGATRKRYCHTGHRHHIEEKEHAGMLVVQHSTIAARDAYAARGGWLSERQMTGITYHREHGQVARATVTPEMLA